MAASRGLTLNLALPEEFRVRRLNELVGRQRHAVRMDRLGETRGDHDHELGLALPELAAAEQRPEDRDVTQARELGHDLAQVVVDEAGQAHRLPVPQLDRSAGAALTERRYEGARRDARPAEHETASIDELADADVDFEVDAVVRQHDRQELDGNAELLELDRHAVDAVRHRDREPTAGQELCFLAG